MFILPIRSDRALKHTPWMNRLLVLANVLCFLWLKFGGDQVGQWAVHFVLMPTDWHWYQFISYQFLHGGWMHLIGNMIFLYVFGNSIEDRLGHWAYLAFYLTGGVIAGIGFSLLDSSPVLGASGSVAAVTGAYLALFPLSRITLLYAFFLIGTIEVPSLLLLLFQFGQDVFMSLGKSSGVAYTAHVAGYLFGFLIGMGLLWTRLLVREPYDMFSLLEHRRRRKQFQSLTRQGYRPWESGAAALSPHRPAGPPSPKEQAIMDLRARVSQLAHQHNYPQASQAYQELMAMDAQQVMPPSIQLDIGNELMRSSHHAQAAQAYEKYLATFKAEPNRAEVELILGLLYARYLNNMPRAKELLANALPKLTDPDQKQLAQVYL